MGFLNTTGFLGEMFVSFTTHVTGTTFLTLLAIMILLIGLFTMFRIPIEVTLILLVPVLIVFMAWNSGGFLAVGGVILLMLSVLLAKNWIVR